MGERITGRVAAGNEGKNVDGWMNIQSLCAEIDKDHQSPKQRANNHTLEFQKQQSSSELTQVCYWIVTSAEPQYYISFSVCVVFAAFFQSDWKPVVSIQFKTMLKKQILWISLQKKNQIKFSLQWN